MARSFENYAEAAMSASSGINIHASPQAARLGEAQRQFHRALFEWLRTQPRPEAVLSFYAASSKVMADLIQLAEVV
jgi:hypothetical protein